MPEIGGPQTPSQHGTFVGSGSPYAVGSHDNASGGGGGSGGGGSGGGSIHHFPHFTPDGIPVYPPLSKFRCHFTKILIRNTLFHAINS